MLDTNWVENTYHLRDHSTLGMRPLDRFGLDQDLKTRITYSAKLETLTSQDLTHYIHRQLERVGLAHTTFTEEAINLITRSSEGALRAVKNLCIGSMFEAVRDRTKTVDLKQVNAVLLQPHWRHNQSNEPTEPVLVPPKNLPVRS